MLYQFKVCGYNHKWRLIHFNYLLQFGFEK